MMMIISNCVRNHQCHGVLLTVMEHAEEINFKKYIHIHTYIAQL